MEEYRSGGQEREQANEFEPTILRQENGQISSKGINADSGDILANPNNTGCKEQREQFTNGTELFTPKCSSWWEAEPGMGRVVDGLPGRVDRLKGLGNAIVPQVAFELFKAVESVHRHGA